jgi:hypothetical protein
VPRTPDDENRGASGERPGELGGREDPYPAALDDDSAATPFLRSGGKNRTAHCPISVEGKWAWSVSRLRCVKPFYMAALDGKPQRTTQEMAAASVAFKSALKEIGGPIATCHLQLSIMGTRSSPESTCRRTKFIRNSSGSCYLNVVERESTGKLQNVV